MRQMFIIVLLQLSGIISSDSTLSEWHFGLISSKMSCGSTLYEKKNSYHWTYKTQYISDFHFCRIKYLLQKWSGEGGDSLEHTILC